MYLNLRIHDNIFTYVIYQYLYYYCC
jgi:hypothetical protein